MHSRNYMKNDIVIVIGNGGLGDMISCIGMVNYLATIYKMVFVACVECYYEHAKTFYTNDKIKVYSINKDNKTTMQQFDIMMRQLAIYDIYSYGHYGAKVINYDNYNKIMPNGEMKKIIHDYPISYYEDVNLPIEYLKKYFHVSYPKEILDLYTELFTNFQNYIVIHQTASNCNFSILKYNKLNINEKLVIDVNKNLYTKGHKFYDIAEKFVNLPSVIYYTKLIENASGLYLLDSCIHAIALIVDINKASPRICYQREYRTKYGFDKFKYYLLVENNIPCDIKLPIDVPLNGEPPKIQVNINPQNMTFLRNLYGKN